MSKTKDNLTTIQYYTEFDPYIYTTDNRPLKDLETNDRIVSDSIDAVRNSTLIHAIAASYANRQVFGSTQGFFGEGYSLPGGMRLTIKQGFIITPQAISDTESLVVMKQGLLLDPATFTFTSPGASGYSKDYLIEAEYKPVSNDTSNLVFYDQNNQFSSDSIIVGACVLTVTEGASATTGNQITPQLTVGRSRVAIITVSDSQSNLSSSDILSYIQVPSVGGGAGASNASNVSYGGSTNLPATDVESALDQLDNIKANLSSPNLTGIPTAPTASEGDRSRQLATTEFVQATIDARPSSETASGILNKLKTVDGSGSGLDADTVDGMATSTGALASTVMVRDSSGRSKIGAPVAGDDIARKDTVDGVQTNLNNHSSSLTAHAATSITVTPAGNITTSNVQAALQELDDGKLPANSYTASDVLAKLVTVDGAGSGLDADLLDGLDSTKFARLDRDNTFAGDITPSGVRSIHGYNFLPGGYVESNPINFRFDQDCIRFVNRWGTATVSSSGFTASELDTLFSHTAQAVNLQSKPVGCYIEVTGISIGSTADSEFYPFVLNHQSDSTFTVKMEVLKASSPGSWQVAYTGTVGGFKVAQFTSASGNLIGVRWTFTSFDNTLNHYIRSLGCISRNGPFSAWNPLKSGDSMYGDLNFVQGAPKVAGAAVWHPGNDGAGSGLDADTLDGIHASGFTQPTVDNNFTVPQTVPAATASTHAANKGQVDTVQANVDSHVNDTSGAHTAFSITNSPAGNIVATDVQSAINELDSEKLAASVYTASDVLAKLLTVDGASSGLDADKLDGFEATYFARSQGDASLTFSVNDGVNPTDAVNKRQLDAVTTASSSGSSNASQVAYSPPSGSNLVSTDVQSAITELDREKAASESPAFSGVVTAPTASAGTNNTQVATTEFAVRESNAANTLSKLLTVDGSGSGLDADLVRGLSSAVAATANTVVIRDASGRFQAVAPSAASDVAIKDTVDQHVNDTTGAHAAASISVTPTGSVASTTVQDAIAELDAEKLAVTAYTASDILAKIKTVDGAGSGLDADTLDGLSSSSFAPSGGSITQQYLAQDASIDDHVVTLRQLNAKSFSGGSSAASGVIYSATGNVAATNVQDAITELDSEKLPASSYTAADVLAKLLTVDGAGSGLDADRLGGLSPAALATPSTVVTRDASGRFQAASPASSADVAIKDNVDTVQNNLTSHETAAVLDHPDGSVTDAKIGNRTVDPNLATPGSTGNLTQLLSWITGELKQVLGTTNWYDAAPVSLTATKNHINATAGAHAASSISNIAAGNITATTVQAAINQLDTNKAELSGPVFTGAPSAPTALAGTNNTQIATTEFVQTANSGKLDASAYTASDVLTKLKTVDGSGSGIDSDFLRSYAPDAAATGNTLALRDASGRLQIAAPSAASDAARKDTVDAVQNSLNSHVNASTAHAATSISYIPSGSLSTTNVEDAINELDNSKLASVAYTAADVLAKIKTVDGINSGLDADLLDGMNTDVTATANTVMVRDVNGRAQVSAPVAAADIARKDTVDAVANDMDLFKWMGF